MAYRDDIDALNPDHHWVVETDGADRVGTATGTNSGMVFTAAAIAEDASNAMRADGRSDRLTLANQADMNSAALDRRAVGGWFQVSSLQTPPCRIYGEGNNADLLHMVLGFGNYVMFEIYDGAGIASALQIPTDRFLANDRPYHLFMKYEGTSYGNFFKAYLDGVLLDTVAMGTADLDTHTGGVPTWGDPSGTVGIAGGTVVLVAANNGDYNHWVSFSGADAASLSDTEVREELFEKGALAGETISSGTEGAMQTALDLIDNAAKPDEPLNIRVQALSGGGDLSLDATNIVHSNLASIHVQYMGTDTLIWRNVGTSNASISSTPAGGTVVFAKPVTVKVTVQDAKTLGVVEGARVLVAAAAGGPETLNARLFEGVADVSGIATGTYDFTSSQPVTVRVRKGSGAPNYKTGTTTTTITALGIDIVVLLASDD